MKSCLVLFFPFFSILLVSFHSETNHSEIDIHGKKSRQDTLKEQIIRGKEVYSQNCISCHQENGKGVPGLAPPLRQTDYVLGDKARLIQIILNGFNEDVEIKGEYYSNPMPAFDYLSDKEIADVLSYVRNSFDNRAGGISSTDVVTQRKATNK